MTSYTTLLSELKDGVLQVTLNRPERLNAYNDTMEAELIDVFRSANADDAIRVLIVTGAGRGFCAGADLGARRDTFTSSKTADPAAYRDGGGQVSLEIFECHKPVIAAINGPAVGVGITMTLPMDIRIASERARMGFVFTRRGMVPEACSTFFLPRLVGLSQASEWIVTGRVFSAEEALRGRLVSQVVAHDELLPAAHALAREIVDNTAPVSVTLARHMLYRQLGASTPLEAHRLESKGIRTRGNSADAAEGIESFLEKRPARFPLQPSRDMPDYFPWWEREEF